MKASRRMRNAPPDAVVPATETGSLSYLAVPIDIRIDIAHVVRTFEFTGTDSGTCLARAALGNATLIECGLTPRLVAGGMLYRVGPHRRRDTIRFCLPDNRGGYLALMDSTSYLIGHVWNEIGGEIGDFSAGDWQAEMDRMYASETNLDDLRLGWSNGHCHRRNTSGSPLDRSRPVGGRAVNPRWARFGMVPGPAMPCRISRHTIRLWTMHCRSSLTSLTNCGCASGWRII